MFASVNLPLLHKVQKFSSDTDSPGWSRKKGLKMVLVVWIVSAMHKISRLNDKLTSAYNSDVNSGLAYALGNMYRDEFVILKSELTPIVLAAFYLQFSELKDA